MVKWHIKEISDLTKISVRMLRHYDKIGLLKPSYRESNGYRCYTEPDFAKLQQIIALRYFGFDLSTIKNIVQKHNNIYAHLQAQQQVIKKQHLQLQQVGDVLDGILNGLSPSASPDWKDLLSLIERYNMTNHLREKLKNSWAGKELTEEQFEDFLFLYEQFPEEFAIRDAMIQEINSKAVGDPDGPDGERIVCAMHDIAKKMKTFYTQHLKLGSSILASIQSGKLTQLEITPEGGMWFARATLCFWLKRWNRLYDNIVENLKADPAGTVGKKLAREWRGISDDVFSIGSRDFQMGLILWQELSRQDYEMKDLKTIPSPQDMLKPYHVQLLFNPDAAAWISRALEVHA